MPHEVTLYTRRGCHLCDCAKSVLQRYGLVVTEVDIDEQTEFYNAYHEWVPVVAIDQVERFRGKIDERLLKRLLQRSP